MKNKKEKAPAQTEKTRSKIKSSPTLEEKGKSHSEPQLGTSLFNFALGNATTILKSAKGSLKTLGILENESVEYLQEHFKKIRKNPSVVLAEKTAKALSIQIGTSIRKELVDRMGDTLGISERAETEALRSKLEKIEGRGGRKKSPGATKDPTVTDNGPTETTV